MLDILRYDVPKNKIFFLELQNLKPKLVIVSEKIGHFDKNGGALKVSETHDLVCCKLHEINYIHDPCTDVAYTKCLFNRLLRVHKYKYIQLYNKPTLKIHDKIY